jgi:hypothetical protein
MLSELAQVKHHVLDEPVVNVEMPAAGIGQHR